MKQLKFLFIVHIGILVSTTFTSCGSDDGPYLPSKDEQYEMWLEDVTYQYDGIQDDMAFDIQDGKAFIKNV